MKVETYQGTFYDDSALNGIRLKCSDGQELSSREGPDGQWSSWTSSSHGLTAADMRSEPRDSWAAAAIKFRVRTAEWSTLIGPDPSRYCALIGGTLL